MGIQKEQWHEHSWGAAGYAHRTAPSLAEVLQVVGDVRHVQQSDRSMSS
jgi:hypothetical protein